GLAGDVADRVEMRIAGAAVLVDRHEGAVGHLRLRALEAERVGDSAPPHGHQHAIEALRPLALDGRLDGGTDVLDRGDLAPEVDGREELLAATGQRLHEIAVHAGEQPVHHFHDSDATTEGGIDLTQLEADVAAAHHEEAFGNLRDLQRPRRVHDAVAADGEAGRHHRRRARGHDGVLEARALGLAAADADAPRVLEGAAAADDSHALGLGDRGEPARQLADHALGLPLAYRIEGDVRLAEVDAELLGALRLAEHGGHVQ